MGLFGDSTGPHPVTWFKGFIIGIILMFIVAVLAVKGVITIPFLTG